MKLIVFGATGSLGRHIVRQALDQGHRVTAFARDPSSLDLQHPALVPVAGDVLDPHAVAAALEGQEAVLIALGAGRKGGLRAPGTRNVVDAMQRGGPRRLVCLSTLGAGDSRHHLNFFWKRVMFGWLLRDAYADHQAQEAIVQASGLDWTIVRPGAFTDDPATGDYMHGSQLDKRKPTLRIARADVAGFMLGELARNDYLHRTPALSN